MHLYRLNPTDNILVAKNMVDAHAICEEDGLEHRKFLEEISDDEDVSLWCYDYEEDDEDDGLDTRKASEWASILPRGFLPEG